MSILIEHSPYGLSLFTSMTPLVENACLQSANLSLVHSFSQQILLNASMHQAKYRGASVFTFHSHALEKEMATHSSVLAWRIPGTGSLVGCRLCGRTESDTTEAT